MMTPPKAEKRPYPITIHGDTRVDDYYWLRDDERADRQCWTTCRRRTPTPMRC